LLVIALGLAVMGHVIVGYNKTKAVLNSNHYYHAEETVKLWKQGTYQPTQDISSIFGLKIQTTAPKDTLP